jgi:small subunit ribosomal protein S21
VIFLAYVEVNPGESFDSALRRFKRKVQQEAIIKDIKKHNVYIKPGEKKRLKIAQAKKRMRKRIKREYTEF